MRGKAPFDLTFSLPYGITPAYAGKSAPFCCCRGCNGDHPRLCGEKTPQAIRGVVNLGSPPPMRGKASRLRCFFHTFRITPAYAGKRSACRRKRDFGRDHPRLCGEKSFSLTIPPVHWGSPPPMRGKAHPATIIHDDSRITPAYAGKRSSTSFRISSYQDHPRLCGEKVNAQKLP